jgi:hypothetical protein
MKGVSKPTSKRRYEEQTASHEEKNEVEFSNRVKFFDVRFTPKSAMLKKIAGMRK